MSDLDDVRTNTEEPEETDYIGADQEEDRENDSPGSEIEGAAEAGRELSEEGSEGDEKEEESPSLPSRKDVHIRTGQELELEYADTGLALRIDESGSQQIDELLKSREEREAEGQASEEAPFESVIDDEKERKKKENSDRKARWEQENRKRGYAEEESQAAGIEEQAKDSAYDELIRERYTQSPGNAQDRIYIDGMELIEEDSEEVNTFIPRTADRPEYWRTRTNASRYGGDTADPVTPKDTSLGIQEREYQSSPVTLGKDGEEVRAKGPEQESNSSALRAEGTSGYQSTNARARFRSDTGLKGYKDEAAKGNAVLGEEGAREESGQISSGKIRIQSNVSPGRKTYSGPGIRAGSQQSSYISGRGIGNRQTKALDQEDVRRMMGEETPGITRRKSEPGKIRSLFERLYTRSLKIGNRVPETEKLRHSAEENKKIRIKKSGMIRIEKGEVIKEAEEDNAARSKINSKDLLLNKKNKEKRAARDRKIHTDPAKTRGAGGALSTASQSAKDATATAMRFRNAHGIPVGIGDMAAGAETGASPAVTKVKVRAFLKAAAKKAVAGMMATTVAVGAMTGGSAFMNEGTRNWVPVQAHTTVDGSDDGRSMTQDVLEKMYARLGAYGIQTSYSGSSTSGPLTIHIPGYEVSDHEIRDGDSQTILIGGSSCILIDGGCDSLSEMTQEYLSQKGITNLTAVITHWHYDHYSCLARILNSGSVHIDTLYCPPPEEIMGYEAGGAYAGQRIEEAVEAQGGRVVHPAGNETSNINISGLNLSIWRETARGSRDAETSVNNTSMQIYFPDLYYLTCGDIIYSLPHFLETMKGKTIKMFEIPHHGNGGGGDLEMLKENGAEVCWYDNVEPGGDMDNSGFPVGAKACRRMGYEIFQTIGDINIAASGGRVTITGQGKSYSYACPYNPTGVAMSSGFGQDLVEYATQWIDRVPYKSSVTDNDPNGERFEPLAEGRGSDCSWFVFHCLEHFGILDEFVHSYEWGTEPDKYPGGTHIGTDISLAQPGDILCYAYGSLDDRRSSNSHVTIYIGDEEQVGCEAGYGGVTTSGVDTGSLIQIVRFDGAGTATSAGYDSYAGYPGTDTVDSRYGLTPETSAIVDQHIEDFDHTNFNSFMEAAGGYENYLNTLGGVFAKYNGITANVTTASQFQEVAEYVMGLLTIWGVDYGNGEKHHDFNKNYGQTGRFYDGYGEGLSYYGSGDVDEMCSSPDTVKATNCNCGCDLIMFKAGLFGGNGQLDYSCFDDIPEIEAACSYAGGFPIYNYDDLQVGDLVQYYWNPGYDDWHHVAVVGEKRADGTVIMYDTGSRYVETAHYKWEFTVDSSNKPQGTYSCYDSWIGMRVCSLVQDGTFSGRGGMATANLKDIKIASVKIDGDLVDKSDFSYRTLRRYQEGDKKTSSVQTKFKFVDKNGNEIGENITGLASGQTSSSGAVTMSDGTVPATGTRIDIPQGLGRSHTFMSWRSITDPSSNQYRLREGSGEHYDQEGIGIIDGRYVIACTSTFGSVGDKIDFYQEDGLVFHCVIGDIKRQTDPGATKWGHKNGNNIIEFVVDQDTWYGTGHDNPGTASCHPEWSGNLLYAVNLGTRGTGGSIGGGVPSRQGQYDQQAMELIRRILSMSVLGSFYAEPDCVIDYDKYCFDILDYAVCDYHGADVEYTTRGDSFACLATVTVCCSLPELEKGDANFTSWEYDLVYGDLNPTSYMDLSRADFETVFNVRLTSPANLSTIVFSGVEQEVYSFFLGKGLGAAQIAGLMGNIKAESSFNPGAVNSSSGASGLFQWLGGRLQGLKDFAVSNGTEWTDIQTQLEYAWKEIEGDGWNGKEAQKHEFMQTGSAYEAAALFCNYWERCGIAAEASRRGTYAEEYYARIMAAASGTGSNIDYVQWAVAIAEDDSHGYSQPNRGGNPDYDCSSLVFFALKNAGYDVGSSPFSTYTMDGVLTGCGFRKIAISGSQDMQPGDILWSWEHTEIYVGDGKAVGAHSDEHHGIAGKTSGDQDGHEISVKNVGSWHYVYRKQ